ncbi:hypothetical protein ACX800_09885 [Paenarthrobacter nitroguajacolicus]|uniref:hypothetical protein n=1 Tax=Paenarthrobacter nitroguajacolicus TaxID=211146 RepID=UPI003D1E29D6
MTDTKIASPVFAVRLPLALDVLGKVSDATQTLWGEVYMVQIGQYLVITTEGEVCDCYECSRRVGEVIATSDPTADLSTRINNNPVNRMIVCPECGNKRCPRATSHDEECTASNDPGQEGSRYE